MIANYTTGANHAHTCCKQHDSVFNCRMFGTMNFKLNDANILSFSPSITTSTSNYWFIQLEKNGIINYAWAIRNHTSSLPKTRIEVISKNMLPELYKTGDVSITIFEKWDNAKIEKWAKSQYWFQTFNFTPDKKADSEYIWNKINVINWSSNTILDIGCHYGFFSFKASECGASVTGFEPNKKSIDNARIIQKNIIHQDVNFVSKDPGRNYDIILYLSVHHQSDPNYSNLKEKINELKNRINKHLFVELILPPTFPKDSSLSCSDIDNIVGGKILDTYKHRVRGVRRIYHVQN